MAMGLHGSHGKKPPASITGLEQQENLAKLRLVLAIATTGRPKILAQTLEDLARQSRKPDMMVISVAAAEDCEPGKLGGLGWPCLVVNGPKGSSAQRNRALEMLGPNDILMMIDDDFLMAPDYLEQLMRLFETRPEVAMVTGRVLADGICGPGFDFAQGRAYLGTTLGDAASAAEEAYSCYGCNMAVRALPVLDHALRFDERLPLYAWLEDVDFSRRLASHGRILRSPALVGVHLGTKTGRQSGLRLGYSQVANPLYLIGKGTMSPRRALRLMARNIAANLLRAARPEPWVDRRGRLKGNFLAMADLLRGRMKPERVLALG